MREHPNLAKVLLYQTKGGKAPEVSALLSTTASSDEGDASVSSTEPPPSGPPVAPVA